MKVQPVLIVLTLVNLVVVRKNSIRAIEAEYEHESHGMMSA